MQNVNLTDHFLIAMPAMADPYFAKSLIYIAEHNEQGALGLIVNRPDRVETWRPFLSAFRFHLRQRIP